MNHYFISLRKHKISSQGFTLIEFVIYATMVGTMLLAAGGIALNVMAGKAKGETLAEISQNARFSLEKISRAVVNAEAINTPVVGATTNQLSLQEADSSKNPTVFDLSGGIVRIKEGTASPIALTSSELTVTSLQFINLAYAGKPSTIRVQLTLKLNNPNNRQEYSFERIFYTTANVREGNY